MKKRTLVFLLILCYHIASAQDPHFTQFYAAPLTVNPAYTGVFSGKTRLMSNYRQQWKSASANYNTVTLAVDHKVGSGAEGQNPLNFGIMLMNDQSISGVVKSNYITGTASYHVRLDEEDTKNIGLGLSASYGSRQVDFSGLSFSNQFMGSGFNTTLPSGEAGLNNLKPFFSVGAGLLLQSNNFDEGNFFDVGISAYHLNKPEQTVMKDDYQYVPLRFSVQGSFQKYLSEEVLLNFKALYQYQANIKYFLGGFSAEKLLGENKGQMIGAGLWYRSGDALSPYVRLGFGKFLIGASYDMTISTLKSSTNPARSYELSLQYIFKERE
jgi:type IX secretion system PorP/SprF family membrane protein